MELPATPPRTSPSAAPVRARPIRLRSPHGAFDGPGGRARRGAARGAVRGSVGGRRGGLDTDERPRPEARRRRGRAHVGRDRAGGRGAPVIDYVEGGAHLRQLSLSLILALAMTTILLGSYPFQPATFVKTFFFTLMVVAVGSIAMLLFQMNRDTTMSRITRTVPGEVTWDVQLVLNLLLVAAVPILTLVSTQFPQVREFLFTSWLTPALSAIAKS